MRRSFFVGLLLTFASAACFFTSEEEKATQRVIDDFKDRHSSAPWYDHIERMRPGPVAQFDVYTDIEVGQPGWKKNVDQICEAALGMMQDSDPDVNVYGYDRRRDETLADGSVKKGERFDRQLATEGILGDDCSVVNP